MRVRQVKSEAELGLSRPRVFRQWKLGNEPPQFGDLSVTEAQLYLATGSDVEAIFLDEMHGDSPGFWARTDPVYDPHRLLVHVDALNRPYIGMQLAIPASWVEVPVRYSKQTARTLAKLGRTSRAGYRAVKEQIRSWKEDENPVGPDPATSCGCGFNDHHHTDHDWIELPRVLTTDHVLHVLTIWPVLACGQQVDLNPQASRTFPPRRYLETDKPWQYCARCWSMAKRRLLDLFREQMMCETRRSLASQASENGASSTVLAHQASEGPDPEPEPAISTVLLVEPKTYLPTVLQQNGLASSRTMARVSINVGSVSIEGWPPIAHRHTFKSADLNGKLLRIGGRPALRFTTQVTVAPTDEQIES